MRRAHLSTLAYKPSAALASLRIFFSSARFESKDLVVSFDVSVVVVGQCYDDAKSRIFLNASFATARRLVGHL